MDKVPIKDKYNYLAKSMENNLIYPRKITKHDVYQPVNRNVRKFTDIIMKDCILPKSKIVHFENLNRLYEHSQQGKACLILMEHYSNFDFPALCFLLDQKGEKGKKIDDALIAMAAHKLNEESIFVQSFTEGFSRIVIVPARQLELLEQKEDSDALIKQMRTINKAALKEISKLQHDQKIILMFPSGTRYRPHNPDSKRILPAVDAYIKRFDYLVFIGMTGELLIINDENDMSKDFVQQDKVVFAVSRVYNCKQFRKKTRKNVPEDADTSNKRLAVAAMVQKQLEEMHKIAKEHY